MDARPAVGEVASEQGPWIHFGHPRVECLASDGGAYGNTARCGVVALGLGEPGQKTLRSRERESGRGDERSRALVASSLAVHPEIALKRGGKGGFVGGPLRVADFARRRGIGACVFAMAEPGHCTREHERNDLRAAFVDPFKTSSPQHITMRELIDKNEHGFGENDHVVAVVVAGDLSKRLGTVGIDGKIQPRQSSLLIRGQRRKQGREGGLCVGLEARSTKHRRGVVGKDATRPGNEDEPERPKEQCEAPIVLECTKHRQPIGRDADKLRATAART